MLATLHGGQFKLLHLGLGRIPPLSGVSSIRWQCFSQVGQVMLISSLQFLLRALDSRLLQRSIIFIFF
jgi:hypothetical protein